jgi:hypothetical protein
MLGLQRPSGERAAEIGTDTVVEGAAISLTDLARRHSQDQHLRILFFRVRAQRRVRNLVSRLPQTATHSAASAVRSAAAASRARRLNFLAPSQPLCRKRSANRRHARAHGEQRDEEDTDGFRLTIHAAEYTASCGELFNKSYNRRSYMAIKVSRAAGFNPAPQFAKTPANRC